MSARLSRDETEARQHFTESYGVPTSDLVTGIERRVIGATWGANGYTTLEQADELRRRLDLQPGEVLLDVGTGRGWPGLYIAQQTGCRVIGTDLPLTSLRVGIARAASERLDSAAFVAASGGRLPFRSGAFDAIVHTDVLC